MSKYRLSKAQAEAAIRTMAENPPSANKEPWGVYIGEQSMVASPPAAYRLAFGTGGLTARKSSRSDRWCLFHGIG